MVTNPDLAIRVLFPTAVADVDYRLEDHGDGLGPRIGMWNRTLGQQPTMADLEAVDTVAEQARRDQAARVAAATANPVVLALLDEVNLLRIASGLPARTIQSLALSIASKS